MVSHRAEGGPSTLALGVTVSPSGDRIPFHKMAQQENLLIILTEKIDCVTRPNQVSSDHRPTSAAETRLIPLNAQKEINAFLHLVGPSSIPSASPHQGLTPLSFLSAAAFFPSLHTSLDPARISASSKPAMVRTWPLPSGFAGRFLNHAATRGEMVRVSFQVG